MKYYPYNPDVDIPIYDEGGERLFSIPRARARDIFNKNGERLSKTTLKIPQASGFNHKENLKNRNKKPPTKEQRKKQYKNIKQAIQKLESHTLEAAQLIVDIMMGDKEGVGSDIKLSERMTAARLVITEPYNMKKKLEESEEEKLRGTSKAAYGEARIEEEEKQEEIKPLISLTVPKSN